MAMDCLICKIWKELLNSGVASTSRPFPLRIIGSARSLRPAGYDDGTSQERLGRTPVDSPCAMPVAGLINESKLSD